MVERLIQVDEATAAKRRVYFDLRDATDGITSETGESGQAQRTDPAGITGFSLLENGDTPSPDITASSWTLSSTTALNDGQPVYSDGTYFCWFNTATGYWYITVEGSIGTVPTDHFYNGNAAVGGAGFDGQGAYTGATYAGSSVSSGPVWTETGISAITHIGYGRYYAALTAGAVDTVGEVFLTRYNSAAVVDTPGDTVLVVNYDPAEAEVDLTKIHGTALAETSAGYLSAAFEKLFDVASPLLVASDVMRGTDISLITTVVPLIPHSIDLASTATVRLGLMIINALDDLPSTGEITPGTISIARKAIGGASWSAVVTDEACSSEQAGAVYYDEVFDSGSNYAEGDTIRVTFKSQKITVGGNDHEIIGATGVMFQTSIRQTMRGTNGANTTAPNTVIPDVAGTAAGLHGTTDGLIGGLNNFDGTGATLHSDYDAAKTAAQAGNAMTLSDNAITAAKIAVGAFEADAFVASALNGLGDWNTVVPPTVAEMNARTLVSAGYATAAKLLAYVQLLARKDYAISQDNSDEVTAINADGGSGGGTFTNTTDAVQALRDRGDQSWLTGGSGGATKSYVTTNWTRTVGDNDGGVPADTATVNATYYATGEINSTTLLEVDAVFTLDSETETALGLNLWGYYAGGGSHVINVQAYNTVDSVYEPIGVIGLGTEVVPYTFNLSPNHTDSSTGVVTIKFVHSAGTGITSHVLNIDKCEVNSSVPSTTAAKLLSYVQLLARSDAAIETDRSTELDEINGDEGSGAGNFSSQTDSVEAIRDRGDAAWVTGAGGGAGGDATEAKQDTIIVHLTDVKGTAFAKDTDSLVNLAHIGADSDTLKTLSDQIDGIAGGSGSGARTVTVTVDDGTTALENATVRFTEGVNTYTGSTNASGVIVFSLDDATYTVSISKAGYTFTPTTKIVNGTEADTYSMAAVTITAPPNASTTTGVMTVYDEEGSVESGVTVTVQIIDGPGTAGIGYDSTEWAATSNGSGVVEFAGIILGARYKIWRGTSKPEAQTFTAPTTGTSFNLTEVIGRG